MPAIQATNLRKEYAGGVLALRGVDLSVEPGEIFAYLGRNGSGKTTTVRILTTLTAPTSGSATVAGHSVVAAPGSVRRLIGVTMQEAALDPGTTGREHLKLAAGLWGLSRADRVVRARELLDSFGVAEAADRQIGGYSGGMRRRLDVATALLTEPQVLFLDEPTTGLDPQSRRALWAEITRLRDRGATVFLTTQYIEEAEALADHIAVIDGGLVVARGTVAELKGRYGKTSIELRLVDLGGLEALRRALAGRDMDVAGHTIRVELAGNGDGAAAAVVDIAARISRTKLELAGFAVREPSLEEAFVELTGSGISIGTER